MSRSILQFVNGVNVKYYGATGDGETDDTTAITNAIAAIPSTGGVLYFPPGTYVTSGGFTLSYPTIVQGAGSGNILGDGAVSQVNCTSATASLFTVNSRKATFRDIAMKCTHATPTNGAGITVTSAYLHQKVDYDNISVYGFYININIGVGAHWCMHNAFILNPALYGVKIANTASVDSGDWVIDSCWFNPDTRDSDAAIYIASSGGGKISNVKINRNSPGTAYNFVTGIDLAGGGTSILMIEGNSIENVDGNAIRITTSGNSGWDFIIIEGNQIAMYGSTSTAISISCANINEINGLIVANNIFISASTEVAAVTLSKVDNAVIGPNVRSNFSGELAQSNCTNIRTVTTA